MPVTPIKVLKFVAAFGWGGTERQFVNLALGLDASRFAVHFGCLRRYGVLLQDIESFRVPVFNYDVVSVHGLRAIAAQLALARDIRRLGIHIVHTYGFYSNVFAIPAAKLAGATVIASIRDMGVYLSPRQRLVQRWICKLADKVLVNAEAVKSWLVSDGYHPDRLHVIPNGVDVMRFAEAPRSGSLHSELGVPADAPLVAVIGRINRLKGLEDFLAASAIVSKRFPSARFVIMGESSFTTRGRAILLEHSYQQELSALAHDLGVSDRVIFSGYHADVEQVLPELAVSVLPSLSEGLSNSLLESMAAGVAVVATRVGGTAEVVDDGENGLLVPPGDTASLADAISRVLSDRDLAERIGRAARRRMIDRYSMQRLVESTSEFYEAVIASRATAATVASLRPI